jgi:hypothetical protein
MARPGIHARLCALLLAALAGPACDPYQRYNQNPNDSLGPVDPINFPPANLGTKGDRTKPGQGSFVQVRALAGGQPANYFAFPVPAAQLMAMDPLAASALTIPAAYAFSGQCQKPPGYEWTRAQEQLDEVPLDRQGSIFTALPRAMYTPGVAATSSYVPLVSAVPVDAKALSCQLLKSEGALKAAHLDTKPDGRLLAWLMIEPAAQVYAVGKSPANDFGFGLQSYGWYERYLVAYLDGGEAPVSMDGKLVPQKLYYPRSQTTACKAVDANTAMTTMPAAGRLGGGFDVLQARRDQPGYSPLCQVFSFDAGATPIAAPGDDCKDLTVPRLPADAQTIETMYAMTIQPATPAYVYCLQVLPSAVVPQK